tara:strand:- start:7 stop:633 length:627 start_codon:yes stop_codon:yes gene_type:complete
VSGGGSYELYVDNIMDLSHTDYLHADTLGGGGVVFNKPKVSKTEQWIEVVWDSHNAPPPPIYRKRNPDLPELVDLTLRVRWYPASVMQLDAEVRYDGRRGDDCIRSTAAHLFTPETRSHTHYFYSIARNYAVDDGELNQTVAEQRTRIFRTEDKPMIEKVHAAMQGRDFWDMKPLLLRIDEGGVQVRRRLQELIESEEQLQQLSLANN